MPLHAAVLEFGGSNAAILVLERGALWPGSSLDWAQHVSVVSLAARRSIDSVLLRVRRAALRLPNAGPLACVVVSFADAPGPPASTLRSDLVRGLGALLADIGCRHLILAGYHIERLELAELVSLSGAVAPRNGEPLRVEIRFHRTSRTRDHRTRRIT